MFHIWKLRIMKGTSTYSNMRLTVLPNDKLYSISTSFVALGDNVHILACAYSSVVSTIWCGTKLNPPIGFLEICFISPWDKQSAKSHKSSDMVLVYIMHESYACYLENRHENIVRVTKLTLIWIWLADPWNRFNQSSNSIWIIPFKNYSKITKNSQMLGWMSISLGI